MKPDRIKRINKISELLKNKEVNTQEELVNVLKKHGIIVTQATLSRDLADLGAVKVHKDGKITYKFPSQDTDLREFRNVMMIEVTEVVHNENVIVVKTRTGCAQSVAVVIDSWKNKDILASIAGDDAILLIPRSVSKIKKITEVLAREWNLP